MRIWRRIQLPCRNIVMEGNEGRSDSCRGEELMFVPEIWSVCRVTLYKDQEKISSDGLQERKVSIDYLRLGSAST